MPSKLSKNPEVRKRQLRRIHERHVERKRTDPEYRYKYNLKKAIRRKYDLSLDQLQLFIDAQDNKCAICGLPPEDGKRLDIEHCHKLNFVRGLCCHSCNLGLKQFKDDIRLLRLAVAYLEGFPGQEE